MTYWESYRAEVQRLKEFLIKKFKERFTCRRLISVMYLSKLGPNIQKCLTEKRVNRLYKDARFKLALKMKMLAKRRQTRYGQTLEDRLRRFYLKTNFSLYASVMNPL